MQFTIRKKIRRKWSKLWLTRRPVLFFIIFCLTGLDLMSSSWRSCPFSNLTGKQLWHDVVLDLWTRCWICRGTSSYSCAAVNRHHGQLSGDRSSVIDRCYHHQIVTLSWDDRRLLENAFHVILQVYLNTSDFNPESSASFAIGLKILFRLNLNVYAFVPYGFDTLK